jgi:hypothetical protein
MRISAYTQLSAFGKIANGGMIFMKTDVANDFLVYVIEEYKFLESKNIAI